MYGLSQGRRCRITNLIPRMRIGIHVIDGHEHVFRRLASGPHSLREVTNRSEPTISSTRKLLCSSKLLFVTRHVPSTTKHEAGQGGKVGAR